MSILVVDDQPSICILLADALEQAGYAVVTATSGPAALTYLRQCTTLPRLILLDIAMPRMTGWEFVREQQRTPALAAIPVIVMTALGEFGPEAEGAGIVASLYKPLDLDRLFAYIHDHYGRQLRANFVA